MGNDEESVREEIIAAIMKGIEIKTSKLIVIAAPYSGDEAPEARETRGRESPRRRRPSRRCLQVAKRNRRRLGRTGGAPMSSDNLP